MDIFRKAYRELTPDEVQALNDIKSKADELYTMLSELKFKAYSTEDEGKVGVRDFTVTADPRAMALAKTQLEQAVMWATKSITG